MRLGLGSSFCQLEPSEDLSSLAQSDIGLQKDLGVSVVGVVEHSGGLDVHADAAYRRGLVATLIERGLRAAAQQGGA